MFIYLFNYLSTIIGTYIMIVGCFIMVNEFIGFNTYETLTYFFMKTKFDVSL